MTKWRTIKRPPAKTTGLIVIETDDGYYTDYDVWLPFFKELSKKYSEFRPYNFAMFCPSVNIGYLNNPSYLTTSQLKELSKWTEIMNHGKYHAGLGKYPLSSPASSGQNRINLTHANEVQVSAGYEYIIQEGGVSETIKPIFSENMEVPIATRTGTYILLENNLLNNYTTSATIQLMPQSLSAELTGAIQDMKNLNIEVSNHVYPYHSGSQHFANLEKQAVVKEVHSSSRGILTPDSTINLKGADVSMLKARGTAMTQSEVDTLVANLKASDGVFIWYFHGTKTAISFLDMLLKTAIENGVRIVTRKQAVTHLKS